VRLFFIAHALAHHRIGFRRGADGVWSIYFGTVLLGRLDERTYTIYRSPRGRKCYPSSRLLTLSIQEPALLGPRQGHPDA
jgi:hypothetical protein